MLEVIVKQLAVKVLGLNKMVGEGLLKELKKEIGRKYKDEEEAVFKYSINVCLTKLITDIQRMESDNNLDINKTCIEIMDFLTTSLFPEMRIRKSVLLSRAEQFDTLVNAIRTADKDEETLNNLLVKFMAGESGDEDDK